MRARRWPVYWTYAAVLLGFFLRSYQLGADSFVGDEAFTGLLARQPLGDIIGLSLQAEPHPPTYTVILKAWQQWSGESEFSLRFPSAFAGTLLVPLLFRLGAAVGGPQMALAAAFLAAGNPFLVRHSQVARMYSGAATGVAASALLFARGLLRARRPGFPYLVVSLFGLSFHYFALLTLPAQTIATLVVGAARDLRWRWLGAQALLGLLALVWLGRALPFLSTFRLGWLTANSPPDELLLSFIWGSSSNQPLALALGTAAASAALIGLLVARRSLWGLFGPTLTLLPLALAHVLSGIRAQPLVFDRYLIVMLPGMILWLAQGLGVLRPWLAAGALAMVLAAWAPALRSYYDEVGIATSGEMRSLGRDMEHLSGLPPLVLSNLAASDPYFSWYIPPSLPLASTYAFPADPTQPVSFDARVARELQATLAQQREVWLLSLGYPGHPAAIAAERTLEASSYRVSERWYGSVRWLRYFRPSETSIQLGLRFLAPEGALRLEGYGLTPDLAPGYLGLRLDWQAEAHVAGSYGVFVHLLDESGSTVAQGDSDPQWGYTPTSTWQPGETVVDRHVVRLPPDVPAGTYRIALGLYDDRRRLLLPDGDNRWLTPPFQLGPF